jgi:hypothetical protein
MKVYITQEAHAYLWTAIQAAKKTEIAGMGYIRQELDGSFVWHKCLLGPQEVSHGGADFTDPLYFIEQAAKDGVLDDPHFSWMWWHSHCDFDTYWSSTDEKDGINVWRDKSGLSHIFSFVGNHKQEYKMRLDLFDHPLVDHITLKCELDVIKDGRVREQVEADIKEHVTEARSWWSSDKGKAKPASSQGTLITRPPLNPIERADEQAWGSRYPRIFITSTNEIIEITEETEADLIASLGEGWEDDIGWDEIVDTDSVLVDVDEEEHPRV